MSDSIVDRLSQYAAQLQYDDLPPEVVHQAKRVLLDSLGCGLGAFTSDPVKIAREMASVVSGGPMSTILGTTTRTTPDLAAFTNGLMVRYLDFNDAAIGGHASDNFAAVLAAAEAHGASGQDLITGCVLAYEVQATWGRSFELRQTVWDQAVYAASSIPLGVGKVMGLSREQLAEALRISVVGSMALNETRRGALSYWKAAAVPNTGRNAVFAATLASQGFTGPEAIFEGTQGFFAGVTGQPVELVPLAGEDGNSQPFRILESRIKRFPSGIQAQTALEATLEARRELGLTNGRGVREVSIRTTEQSIFSMAGHPSRWRPRTRETADHSLPYVIACALEFGSVKPAHFSEDLWESLEMVELMQKINVEADPECQTAWPEANPAIVTLATTDGRAQQVRVDYHTGHPRKPMDDAEVEKKFRGVTAGLLSEGDQTKALAVLWRIDELSNPREALEQLVVQPRERGNW